MKRKAIDMKNVKRNENTNVYEDKGKKVKFKKLLVAALSAILGASVASTIVVGINNAEIENDFSNAKAINASESEVESNIYETSPMVRVGVSLLKESNLDYISTMLYSVVYGAFEKSDIFVNSTSDFYFEGNNLAIINRGCGMSYNDEEKLQKVSLNLRRVGLVDLSKIDEREVDVLKLIIEVSKFSGNEKDEEAIEKCKEDIVNLMGAMELDEGCLSEFSNVNGDIELYKKLVEILKSKIPNILSNVENARENDTKSFDCKLDSPIEVYNWDDEHAKAVKYYDFLKKNNSAEVESFVKKQFEKFEKYKDGKLEKNFFGYIE